jgi:hypothetical protein
MEVAMKPLIGILIVAAWIAPLHAQDTLKTTRATPDSANATRATDSAAIAPEMHPYRNPREALILGSLIPGAGHIYAGEYLRGVMNFYGTVGGIGLGAMLYWIDNCALDFLNPNCHPGPEWLHQAIGVAVVGLVSWKWIATARDAPHAAERANERHRRRMPRVKPIIGPTTGSHGGWHAGFEIPW